MTPLGVLKTKENGGQSVTKAHLSRLIEDRRAELSALVLRVDGNLQDPMVQEASRELNSLICEWWKAEQTKPD